MRQRLPLILSATAVVIAVLGSTSLGEAAGNAVGQTVQKAKTRAGLAAPTIRRGPRGPRGPRGRRGPPGPPGGALAYAHVSGAFGTLDPANSKSIASSTRVSTGRYCVVPASGVQVKNAVATIGQSGFAISADVGFPSTNCATGIEVRTFDGGGAYADNDFYLLVN